MRGFSCSVSPYSPVVRTRAQICVGIDCPFQLCFCAPQHANAFVSRVQLKWHIDQTAARPGVIMQAVGVPAWTRSDRTTELPSHSFRWSAPL